jgi:peptidoglycan/LPS O-acetylase OafA/YrhL
MAAYIAVVAAIASFPLINHRFLFLIIFATMLPMIFELTKNWRFDRFLADTSFPLYLCHWTLAMTAWRWPYFWPGMPATVMAIIYSCGLVIFVERPIDRWRHARLRGPDKPDAARFSEAVATSR